MEDDKGDVWAGTKVGLDRFRFSRIRWTDIDASQLGLLPGGDDKPWIATTMLQVPHQIDGEIPENILSLLKALTAGAQDRRGVL